MPDLIIALPKGRMYKSSVSLLEKAGLNCACLHQGGRELFFSSGEGFRFLLVKPVDLPTYVERGVADLGIIGKDVLLEQNRELFEILDLCFGYCRLVVAGPAEKKGQTCSYVATKYPHITEKYFRSKGKQVEVIKLHGSIELAPRFQLADAIVDLVETGATLKANGLVEWEQIAESSARLVANRSSFHFLRKQINELVCKLKEALKEEKLR
ncbi:MAG: ATP phosphoribosyltransferase [Firmicutes bacterium]|nr:ATP phosphoribosyltransferase [Bacillota bacterium]